MTYEGLVSYLSLASDLTNRQIRDVVAGLKELLRLNVVEGGDDIWVPGLGTFYAKKHKRRRVRNPLNRKLMRIDGSIALGFRASKAQKRKAGR